MEIVKINTETVSEKITYSSTSENFNYEVSHTTGTGPSQTNIIAKKNDVVVANFNDWGNAQSNINFQIELSKDEKIELISSFEEIKESLNNTSAK